MKDFDEAIRLKPDYFDAYFQRGFSIERITGISSSALDNFDKAIELNPNDISAYIYRAEIKLLLQQEKLA